LNIFSGNLEQFIQNFKDHTLKEPQERVFSAYINSYSFFLFDHSKDYRAYLTKAHFCYCDGTLAKWTFYILRRWKLYRYSSTDFLGRIFSFLDEKKCRVSILGYPQDDLRIIELFLVHLYPQIKFNFLQGYFQENQEPEILTLLNKAQPNVIFLGLSPPFQEAFIFRNQHLLPKSFIFPIGNGLRYMCNLEKRCPLPFRNWGLEWLYRIYTKPKLWRRYLVSFLWWPLWLYKHKKNLQIQKTLHNEAK
jgi:N-acetylglucosaminyldiphosphoundecaprenol N-acetyl-beta-D-mannosaminyltransferase